MELSVVMFWFASIWILPFWSLMWFVPKHALTQRFVGDLRWCFMPLLVPYIVLAAPQVGESIQLVIFGVDKNERYPEAEEVPFTVLINPVITPLTQDKEDDWEGCLSVPGMRGVVPRYKEINYKGFDQYGNEIDRDVEGFHARVVQHECDHLFGILYPTRIENMKLFGFHDEIFVE